MPGEGSMLHALISSRNNKRNRIDKQKRLENTSNETSEFVDHIQATPELLESIREKMQAERKAEQKKLIRSVTLLIIVLFIVLYIFNHNWKWIEGFFEK
jgi:nitrate/nitrite-specific signal transduction histidine kinase